jgi:PAS domain S-box-containing protein
MKKTKILVVEDERIVADDIRMSLERLGYDVPAVSVSGEDAINKAEKTHPDLVLMDIVLQGKMDGIEAASIIQSRFDMPVVYLTAYADDKTVGRAKITEPFGYILKPFEDRDLQTTIEMALHKHKMRILLEESEERYRGVVENAHDAIYIKTQGDFLYVNPAFEKLTGWKKEELCSKEFNFWKTIHPEDLKFVKKMEKERKKGKEEASSYEFRIISKDRGVKAVEVNTIIIRKDGVVKEIGILRDITGRKQAEKERQQSVEKLKKALEETVNALASAVEMRDPYTAGHQKRVTELACVIAIEMALPEGQIEGLRLSGLIHDIGKIRVPGEILSKPGKLSHIDFGAIEIHPQVAYDILKSVEFPYPVAQIVLQHHERMDGSGYPWQLKGKEILLEARILAVADVVEAIASHRPYRPALGMDKALEEISRNKGTLYDSKVVDACLKLFKEKGFKFSNKDSTDLT